MQKTKDVVIVPSMENVQCLEESGEGANIVEGNERKPQLFETALSSFSINHKDTDWVVEQYKNNINSFRGAAWSCLPLNAVTNPRVDGGGDNRYEVNAVAVVATVAAVVSAAAAAVSAVAAITAATSAAKSASMV